MTHIEQNSGRWSAKAAACAWLIAASLAAAGAAPGCTSASVSSQTGGCSLNSECAAGLICALGNCRKACLSAVDCPMGGTCLDDGRTSACQSPQERNTPCTRLADCHTPLACASDYRCRNLCISDADCNVLGITGRVCAKDSNGVDYCADPGEVSGGVIIIGPPPGAPTTPVIEPEGGAPASLPQGALIATSIGGQGGTLGSSGVTVTIPPGALTQAITLVIQRGMETAPPGTIGLVYDIGPSGTLFSQPVTIAFEYTDAQLAGGAPSDFAVETIGPDGTTWTPLSQIVVDVYAHTIAGQTTHLSPYALVKQQVATVAGGGDASSQGGGEAGAVGMSDDGGAAAQPDTSIGTPAEGGLTLADATTGTLPDGPAPSCVGRAVDVQRPTGMLMGGGGVLASGPSHTCSWTGNSPAVDFSTLVDGYAGSSYLAAANQYYLWLTFTSYGMACGNAANGVFKIGAPVAVLKVSSTSPIAMGSYTQSQVDAFPDGVPVGTLQGACGGAGACNGGIPFVTSPPALNITALDALHVAGDFNIALSDGGNPLTGTFDVPFCASNPGLNPYACCQP